MAVDTATVAALEAARDRGLAWLHPGLLLRHVECIDNTTGDSFRFHFSPEQLTRWATTPNEVAKRDPISLEQARVVWPEGEYEETGWEWQGDLIDWWISSDITLILKARQLGITWCAAGVALWYLLYVPGSRVLIQSKNEDDASDVVDHIWEMYLSLERDKPHLLNGVKVQKPAQKHRRPHLDIELVHRNGKVSQLNAMASTQGAGHGRTAAFVILDEFSRHPYGREAYKAIVPAQGGSIRATGKTAIISTANGISIDEEAGNFYHHLWSHSDTYGIRTRFLRWDQNPDRDEEWYQRVAMKLPPKDRGEQYPRNELEAFILTGDQYFDIEALRWYRENGIRDPVWTGYISVVGPNHSFLKAEFGPLRVWEEPYEGGHYAIAADVATGRGKDFSCAYVIDLSNMALVAELHGKIDSDLFAAQLHFLGLKYNEARIAVEMGGGYGEAVVIPLRDGRDQRPPYRLLYRHRQESSVDKKIHKPFGFPMNTKTRPLVISQLEQAIRDREIPWMPRELLDECQTFVHMPSNPSPRAADGTNDDRVMSAAIALEMFRQFGAHRPWREPVEKKIQQKLLRRRDGSLDPDVLAKRYPAH